MKHKDVLLLEFEGDGHLGTTARRIVECRPDRDFTVACHTCHCPVIEDELLQIVLSQNPLLIVIALPRVPVTCLDSLFEIIRKGSLSSPVLVVIDAIHEGLIDLTRLGVVDFIVPPFRESELLLRIRRILNQFPQEQKTKNPLTEKLGLQQLLGRSSVFLVAISKIPAVAASDTSVLISGETGTGKEMVGRVIHDLSPRADKPFVPINCGAIPVELLENELFGHEHGAFTGASGASRGLIHEADKGTLFMDEVDSLPLLAQVKLLRFLQDKEYRPLGSTKTKKSDVRIVAASNANLEAAVAAGILRRDLYYRLNVVPIMLPPLRERAMDILLLANHFLAKYAAKFNSPAVSFSPEAERKLMLYSWPGNVREIEHVIERVAVLCSQRVVHEDQIVLPGENDRPAGLSFQEMKANVISQFETNYIQNLLIAYRGNISRAAQAAQKERRTFWQLVRKHKIDVEQFRVSA